MSRCFPFPPPGYEKKLTTDDPDLLKKEKRKEKKHKKDKKDKEKREGKEKREKDRSDRKHKEKKEKKDKHRDKKKDKEKGKNPASDEQFKGQNGEKIRFEGQNGEKIRENDEPRKPSALSKNGGYEPPPPPPKHAEPSRERSSSSDDKRSSISFWGQNGDFASQNKVKAEDAENLRFVQELGRRIRDEEKGAGSHQFPGGGIGGNAAVKGKVNGAPPPSDKRVEEKEKEKFQEKKGDDKRKKTDREKHRERKEEKAKEREKNKHVKRTETVAPPGNLPAQPSNSSIRAVGGNENFKKRKDMETNGVSCENEQRPNKIPRHAPNIPTKNGRKPDFLQKPGPILSAKPAPPLNNLSDKPGFKERRPNGLVSPPAVSIAAKRPPKSPPLPPPPLATNHVTSPPHVSAAKPLLPIPTPPAPHPPPAPANKAVPTSKKTHLPSTSKPPSKPPHPDARFLSQVLSVPKMDPWCGFDSQEWLFGPKDTKPASNCGSTDKSSHGDGSEFQVWSEARQIESADVWALPYVIPY